MRRLCTLFMMFILLCVQPLWTSEFSVAQASTYDKEAEVSRTKTLLERAVAHYNDKGEMALAAFCRSGDFIEGDLYVYVVGTDGIFMASGGSSSVLIGRDVTDLKDATGEPFIEEILSSASVQGSGTVDYHWMNRSKNQVEQKTTYYQKVGERIIAVGYYIPRATSEQAKALLKKAATAVKRNPAKAFSSFNNLNSEFVEDDLYVFAVSLGDGRFVAHGALPHLVRSDALDLRDPDDRAIIQEMTSILKTKSRGEIEYSWQNPVTGKVEQKHTFLQKVGNYLLGVGFYTR